MHKWHTYKTTTCQAMDLVAVAFVHENINIEYKNVAASVRLYSDYLECNSFTL